MRARALSFGLLVGVAVAPGHAQAGNQTHPRTPVLWPEDGDCIVDIDRGIDPIFAYAYDIPHEDTAKGIDELEDSRTHQFIGFCRQWPAGSAPPPYVSVDDLERAIEADQDVPETLLDPEATLETSLVWAGCWTRITSEAERRPITFAAAEPPVLWDTTALEPGTWTIAGYTFEPPYNMWRRAPYVLRIYDDDADLPPAVAFASDVPETATQGDPISVEICVRAGGDATLELDAASADLLEWIDVLEQAVEGELLTLDLAAPEPIWGDSMVLRARVSGGTGSYEAFPLGQTIVFNPSEPDEEGSGESGESDGASSSESAGGSGSRGCSSAGGDSGGLLWLGVLVALRGRARARPTAPR